MRLSRNSPFEDRRMPMHRTRAAIAALILIALPTFAPAKEPDRTSCGDETKTASTARNACEGHGGIDAVKTSILRHRRTPERDPKPPTTVAQAGKPAKSERPHGRWRG